MAPPPLIEQVPDDFYEAVVPGERSRISAGLALAIVLVPAFGILDLAVYPAQLKELLLIRLGISAIVALCLWAVRLSKTYRPVAIASSVAFLAIGGGIAGMLPLIGGHRSPYYAGINLAFIGAGLLFTYPALVLASLMLLVMAVYLVPVLFEPTVDVPALLTHSFFLLSTGAISLLAMKVRTQLARQEHASSLALAHSNQKLQEAHRVKDQLFQNLSHEFRTPLSLILAPLETLMEGPPPFTDAQRTRAATIRDNALRLLNLINDLLDLAKLDAVGLTTLKQPVDVGALVTRLAAHAGELAQRQGLEVTAEVAPGLSAFLLDPRHLEKAVLNLLSNAIKFTPAGGRVVVRVVADGAGLTIAVQDTGPGIAPAAQAVLFERFRQLDGTTTRRHGGTGIGLALVKELTELMGGRVSLESEVGRGSTFGLHFPASLRTDAQGADADDSGEGVAGMSRRALLASVVPAPRRAHALQAGDAGPRVLVAEDDPGLSREVVDLLSPHYRVTAVGDGKAALEAALKDPPHLLVSDVMMPEMDGVQLVAALRDLPALRETPIILLSARADLEHRIAGRASGADTYLTKPFHPDELLAAVAGLLRSRLRVVGDWVLYRPLGEGGQSEIWAAEHARTKVPAAVKLLSRQASSTPGARERLRREALALQRITHPQVVRILDHGFEQDRAWIAMELLSGLTVTEILEQRRTLPPWVAVQIAAAVADALDATHREGLTHRDVKGGNVMVVRGATPLRERVRLIDFGIARRVDQATLASGGEVVGTLPYLAPELLSGVEASPASDLYALGVMLYTMGTGAPPFAGGGDAARVTAEILDRSRPSAVTRWSDAPPGLKEVVDRALAFDPAARWRSGAELKDALLRLALEEVPFELPTPGRLADRMAITT